MQFHTVHHQLALEVLDLDMFPAGPTVSPAPRVVYVLLSSPDALVLP